MDFAQDFLELLGQFNPLFKTAAMGKIEDFKTITTFLYVDS